MLKRCIYILGCFIVLFMLSACQSLTKFKDKVVEETKKTMHFTDDNENDTSETMESLIDKGKLDQVVYDDQLYHLKEKVDEDKKGKVIGAIGQTFFVDGDGKRWSEEELKEPYISNNPDEIREKKPLRYGKVYSTNEDSDAKDEIIVEFNREYYRAVLIKNEKE
ncbi:NisI/SpaI family lantibiotic immunity lipoprotein [Bacillus spizizenii]|nr:NisI/SpaI family lantibiotic immunity lipoprotein [Bacillus spizizenii]MCY7972949.1 NisI/SpaI family lantibiotic immunity lipoprotein [Bacillus spizizenii]MCY8108854.1 NisI/SpaI family lantibiotic immunity lipoprotein [Bacillus spizizenii]MCY8303740.1 NisI/SpaI family lantibiotic immunity lipoprotein [Bacillus spizizenii]MCY8602103.1 NisI/SpaI family lantibiotic immunity lipoprotein [Bacillus spizizenii]